MHILAAVLRLRCSNGTLGDTQRSGHCKTRSTHVTETAPQRTSTLAHLGPPRGARVGGVLDGPHAQPRGHIHIHIPHRTHAQVRRSASPATRGSETGVSDTHTHASAPRLRTSGRLIAEATPTTCRVRTEKHGIRHPWLWLRSSRVRVMPSTSDGMRVCLQRRQAQARVLHQYGACIILGRSARRPPCSSLATSQAVARRQLRRRRPAARWTACAAP